MSEWSELPGYPRTFASQCAPWGSSVKFVKGAQAMVGGKSVTLSGAKAFLQRVEIDLISGRSAAPDIAALVTRVLEGHARHIDVVEWCRVRDEELDILLRVYASRGSQRLHLALRGPIGQYADEPLPVHAAAAKPAKPRARAKPPAPVAAPPATTERVSPPSSPLVLRPLVPGARPSYSDPIARDLAGRLHVAVRLPNGDAYACVDPSGSVTLTPLVTRELLRESDSGAMTGAMNMSVYTTTAGVVFIDHYENAAGEQERAGHAGRWHAARRGLWSAEWTLGFSEEWFLRCIVHKGKATLLGVNFATGKRSRVALPSAIDLRGAAIDRRPDDALLLRLVCCGTEEQQIPLRAGKTLELGPVTTRAHGLVGAVQPVPDLGGWVVMHGRTLQLARPDGSTSLLFALPPEFTATDYRPWGTPNVTRVGVGPDAAWQVLLDFGSDAGPRCTGALVFTADGSVRGVTRRDVDGSVHINAVRIPLADSEHPLGTSSGPTGDIAVLLALQDGLTLAWAPPT